MSLEEIPGAQTPRMFVRPAVATDAADLARIQAQSLRATAPAAASRFNESALESHLRTVLAAPAPAGCATLVAIHGSAPVGVVVAVPAAPYEIEGAEGATEILEVGVDQRFRRSGHGTRMITALVDTLAPSALVTWVDPADEARIRFFTAHGFAPAGIRREIEVDPASPPVRQHLWLAAIETETLAD